MRVATTYWLFLTRKRLGLEAAAAALLLEIDADLQLIENHDYLELLLLFKGVRQRSDLAAEPGSISSATLEYGLACHALLEGDSKAARAAFQGLAGEPGAHWAAFGFIAAESEGTR
jgi:hypothetical protein